MWPFNRKKKKEVKPTVSEKEVLDAIQRKRQEVKMRHREMQRKGDILTDPVLSPFSPLSPFSVWPTDESQGHKIDYDHGSSNHHDGGGSSHDHGSSHDSGSYDSGSSDCGGSSGGGD